MGLCLIAETSALLHLASTLYMILKVALGLGAVIFVHELGHFLVAKLCGVKCEKFYVGFDVPIKIANFTLPRAFWKKQWGETEYGVGIIPLGGYVKMLGQDDNPANYQAEAERTRVRKDAKADGGDASPGSREETPAGDTKVSGADASATETSDSAARQLSAAASTKAAEDGDTAAPDDRAEARPSSADTRERPADEYELDPRSFPAKSVPQRMAIISAGVIMNVIFAVVFATAAYFMGVEYTPCVIGATVPGSPAWTAGLEPGSRIIQIGRNGTRSEHLRFGADLMQNVAMTGGKEDIELLIRDPHGKTKWVKLRPVIQKIGGSKLPSIGITSAGSTKIADSATRPPVMAHLPAGEAKPTFQRGDKIVAIEASGTRYEVPDYFRLQQLMALHADDVLTFVVERKTGKSAGGDAPDGVSRTRATVTIAPNRMRRVGLVMEMGPISAIQRGSPAEAAGFQIGDEIATVNDDSDLDPLLIPEMLRGLVGQEVRVQVVRNKKTVDLTVIPAAPVMQDIFYVPGTPLAAQTIGVAFPVLNRVKEVEPGSPADAAGMQKDDELLEASFVPAGEKQAKIEAKDLKLNDDPIRLGEKLNWLYTFERMQFRLPDTKLKLLFQRVDEEKTAELLPDTSDKWHAVNSSNDEGYVVNRGFVLQGAPENHQADSFAEATALGLRNTWESLTQVFTFLRKVVTGQISLTNLGGPGTILLVAGSEAKVSISRLLLFLTLLSANLAIINFLPIPVLDGGHMLFLIYEGVRGKPVNEIWAMRLTMAGLVFILGLMVFVLSLDVYRFTIMWM